MKQKGKKLINHKIREAIMNSATTTTNAKKQNKK